MKMVIHRRITADRNREALGAFLEAILDPRLAVVDLIAQQRGTSHTASQAVIPASERFIDEMGAIVNGGISYLVFRTYCTENQYSRHERSVGSSLIGEIPRCARRFHQTPNQPDCMSSDSVLHVL
jgi:hypothetical protein